MCNKCKCEESVEAKAAEDADKLNEFRFQYGWNWFSYHAEQRTSMFNYSLAASSLLAAGYGAAIDKHPLVAAALGVVGALVTMSFLLIDGRNDNLVRRGERIMKAVEKQRFPDIVADQVDSSFEMPGGILIVNEKGARLPLSKNPFRLFWVGTHRIHLRWIEFIFCAAFILGAGNAIYMFIHPAASEPAVAPAISDLSRQVTELNTSLKALVDRTNAENPAPPVQPKNQQNATR